MTVLWMMTELGEDRRHHCPSARIDFARGEVGKFLNFLVKILEHLDVGRKGSLGSVEDFLRYDVRRRNVVKKSPVRQSRTIPSVWKVMMELMMMTVMLMLVTLRLLRNVRWHLCKGRVRCRWTRRLGVGGHDLRERNDGEVVVDRSGCCDMCVYRAAES